MHQKPDTILDDYVSGTTTYVFADTYGQKPGQDIPWRWGLSGHPPSSYVLIPTRTTVFRKNRGTTDML